MQKLLMRVMLTVSLAVAATIAHSATPTADTDILNKAVEYFQSGKYHESLLMFRRLHSRYSLNSRFMAYMSVCLYYDAEYEQCADIIDSIAPRLNVFAPHEQSVYFYCAAQSCHKIERYTDAIAYYERVLLLCYGNEKGDILKDIGMCYKAMGQIPTAQEYFLSALAYYRKFNQKFSFDVN